VKSFSLGAVTVTVLICLLAFTALSAAHRHENEKEPEIEVCHVCLMIEAVQKLFGGFAVGSVAAGLMAVAFVTVLIGVGSFVFLSAKSLILLKVRLNT
jgi:histidinol dehydrogenase